MFLKVSIFVRTCHYGKKENTRGGLTKKLIAEGASRKNVNKVVFYGN